MIEWLQMRSVVLAGFVACLVAQLALATITTYNDQGKFAAATPNATQFVITGPYANFGST